jgi:hypothetical protein
MHRHLHAGLADGMAGSSIAGTSKDGSRDHFRGCVYGSLRVLVLVQEPEVCRTRLSNEREPADSLKNKSNVISGRLPSLTLRTTRK